MRRRGRESAQRLEKALIVGKLSVPINLVNGRTTKDPGSCFQIAIRDALDPSKMPGRCRTLADMTAEERAAIEAQYGAKIESSDGTDLIPVKVFILHINEKSIKVSQSEADWSGGHSDSLNRIVTWLPIAFVRGDISGIERNKRFVITIPRWLANERRLRKFSGKE